MINGEGIVLRILDKGAMVFNLRSIGMDESIYQDYRPLLDLPHGIILVTGPTGSGKTTTLYSSLLEINTPDVKIVTTEDPVEYQLEGINQIQVHAKIGLTFAASLRSILRHDPDVVLVGEIRDLETAENAIQASLTGHLVFSTLHTNDAAGAYTRLVDMGVEPFLVASTVEAVMAQRLVRRICPNALKSMRFRRICRAISRVINLLRPTCCAGWVVAIVAIQVIAVGWVFTNYCTLRMPCASWHTTVRAVGKLNRPPLIKACLPCDNMVGAK